VRGAGTSLASLDVRGRPGLKHLLSEPGDRG
jgi:hypothetical protein